MQPVPFLFFNMLADARGGLSSLSLSEKEELMGLPKDYTLVAVKSGQAQADPAQD